MRFSKDFQKKDRHNQPDTSETGANTNHKGRSSNTAIRSQIDVRKVDVYCSCDSPNQISASTTKARSAIEEVVRGSQLSCLQRHEVRSQHQRTGDLS
jgi:hypothetical protein